MPRIYRINISTHDQGTLVGWAPNLVNATQKASEMLHDSCDGRRFDKTTDSIDLIDFPETKLDIVRWLNVHFSTDNG